MSIMSMCFVGDHNICTSSDGDAWGRCVWYLFSGVSVLILIRHLPEE